MQSRLLAGCTSLAAWQGLGTPRSSALTFACSNVKIPGELCKVSPFPQYEGESRSRVWEGPKANGSDQSLQRVPAAWSYPSTLPSACSSWLCTPEPPEGCSLMEDAVTGGSCG